ncbi:MAG: zinc ribbon domain-containing protein [Betaproteobacteria bacterium]|nr:zinc ribbon domain-containing protein [Betaproteobacteria bacterium]
MPLYDYRCQHCGWKDEFNIAIEQRDNVWCLGCDRQVERLLSAPLGRMAGQVVQGGGPDRFTADALGIPLHDLPDSLRAEPKKKDG